MGRKKKPYRVYLFTRPPKPKEDRSKDQNDFAAAQPVKLRVQVIANGKSHFAAFSLLVGQFSTYFNSDGTLKNGNVAKSIRERFERDSIAAAYEASCRVAEYMLGISSDYWRLAPTDYFSELVNREYDNICDGIRKSDCYIASRKRNDKEREDTNRVPFWRENLDDWKYKAGEGPEPPTWLGSHMDYSAWKKHMAGGTK